MGSGTAFFLSLLSTDKAHAQQMCIAIGELQAVLGGLMLTAAGNYTPHRDGNEDIDWTNELELGDWLDGIAVLARLTLTVTCAIGFAGGCVVAAAGEGKNEHFYAGVVDVLGFGMITLFIGINCTLAIIAYSAIRTAHPIIATIFVTIGLATYVIFSGLMCNVFAASPLEFFHLPFIMQANMKAMKPFSKELEKETVLHGAIAEAQRLRALLKNGSKDDD